MSVYFLFLFGCLLVRDISVGENKKCGGPKEFLAKPHRNQKLSAKGDGGKKNVKNLKSYKLSTIKAVSVENVLKCARRVQIKFSNYKNVSDYNTLVSMSPESTFQS